jgi:hypothetical protein
MIVNDERMWNNRIAICSWLLAWRDWGNPQKSFLSQNGLSSGRGSNPESLEYEAEMLPTQLGGGGEEMKWIMITYNTNASRLEQCRIQFTYARETLTVF